MTRITPQRAAAGQLPMITRGMESSNPREPREVNTLYKMAWHGKTNEILTWIRGNSRADLPINTNGQNILHVLALNGRASTIAAVLRAHPNRFDVNAEDSNDRTPAYLTTYAGHVQALAVLLAFGANANNSSMTSMLCLQQRAVKERTRGEVHLANYQERLRLCLELLHAYGADQQGVASRHRNLPGCAAIIDREPISTRQLFTNIISHALQITDFLPQTMAANWEPTYNLNNVVPDDNVAAPPPNNTHKRMALDNFLNSVINTPLDDIEDAISKQGLDEIGKAPNTQLLLLAATPDQGYPTLVQYSDLFGWFSRQRVLDSTAMPTNPNNRSPIGAHTVCMLTARDLIAYVNAAQEQARLTPQAEPA